jgi:hypothetical protein
MTKRNKVRFPNSGTPIGCTTATCPNALTSDQANALFRDLANQPNIPFDYPDDCCYSRASEMCRVMKERGIPCGKVWNYGTGYPSATNLRADTPNHPRGHVNWRYHVAPTVPVRGSDGVVRDMVMDPSLFDRPVTIEEWVSAQQDSGSTIELTDATPYFRGPGNHPKHVDPGYLDTSATLARHREARDRRRAGGP